MKKETKLQKSKHLVWKHVSFIRERCVISWQNSNGTETVWRTSINWHSHSCENFRTASTRSEGDKYSNGCWRIRKRAWRNFLHTLFVCRSPLILLRTHFTLKLDSAAGIIIVSEIFSYRHSSEDYLITVEVIEI